MVNHIYCQNSQDIMFGWKSVYLRWIDENNRYILSKNILQVQDHFGGLGWYLYFPNTIFRYLSCLPCIMPNVYLKSIIYEGKVFKVLPKDYMWYIIVHGAHVWTLNSLSDWNICIIFISKYDFLFLRKMKHFGIQRTLATKNLK